MYVYWKEDMWLEELQLQKKLFQVCMELLLMLQSNLAGLFELQTLTVDESTIYM
jgi:hypothetical protein